MNIIKYFAPKYWSGRHEDVFMFSVVYKGSDGRYRWKDGSIYSFVPESPEQLMEKVASYCTEFVKENMVRMEVMFPNRDKYGNLVSGYIEEKGILLAIK